MYKALLVVIAAVALGGAAASAQDAKEPEDRKSLVARSKVWVATNIPSMNLRAGPVGRGAFDRGATITCDYFEKEMSGRSPKFACRTAEGDELKVKYDGNNGEVYAEVVASRLLWALGFGADRMYSVRVVCHGCPDAVGGIVRENPRERILDPATVERKLGEELSGEWTWAELEKTSQEAGGATRAERDALKLLAVLLQHSDSKPQQQRIICLDESPSPARCATPLMMINDLGITFGRGNLWNQQPRGSMNFAEWQGLPVWKGPTGCVGNLSGSFTGTLQNPVISEEGRQFLAGLLMQLSDQQLRDMFEAARVHLRPRAPESGRSGFPSIDEWVTAFKNKRTEVVDRRCAA